MMFSYRLFLAAAATLSFTCATTFSPLTRPNQAEAQANPVVANVIPDGGHYAAQGKLQALDPAAMTLRLVTEKAGPVPMVIAPGTDLSDISVGDVADIQYTRSVTFVLADRSIDVASVPATTSVGQAVRTPGIGPEPATIVGRIVKVNGIDSFDVVNADGGGIYTIKVTNPARQQSVKMLKVGDSLTVSVSPLIATSIAKCGVFGMGLFGC